MDEPTAADTEGKTPAGSVPQFPHQSPPLKRLLGELLKEMEPFATVSAKALGTDSSQHLPSTVPFFTSSS